MGAQEIEPESELLEASHADLIRRYGGRRAAKYVLEELVHLAVGVQPPEFSSKSLNQSFQGSSRRRRAYVRFPIRYSF